MSENPYQLVEQHLYCRTDKEANPFKISEASCTLAYKVNNLSGYSYRRERGREREKVSE